MGAETGSAGNGYSVQNWSNAGVTKVYDIGGSEVYGSSGYVQIRPGPTEVYQGIGDNNNLGVGATTNSTLLSRPSFISSVTGGAGDFVNFGAYSTYRGPDGSSLLRQGALSVAVNNGPYTPDNNPSSYFGIAMHFTVNAGSYFRFGLAVDSVGSGTYAPDYVSLYSSSTGTKISSLLTRDGSADMVFFNVDTRGDAASTNFDVAHPVRQNWVSRTDVRRIEHDVDYIKRTSFQIGVPLPTTQDEHVPYADRERSPTKGY